jgi:hypothetical protein
MHSCAVRELPLAHGSSPAEAQQQTAKLLADELGVWAG